MNLATSYATEAFFPTRVGEVARQKAVIANVAGADEIKSFKDFFLNSLHWDSQCRALQRGHFWLLPLAGVDGKVGRLRGSLVP